MAGHRRKRSLEPPDDGGGSARLTAPPLGASAHALRTAARWLEGADNGRSSNQGTRSGRRRHVGSCICSLRIIIADLSWAVCMVHIRRSSALESGLQDPASSLRLLVGIRALLCFTIMLSAHASERLWLRPWWHAEQQEPTKRPHAIGQSSGHRWRPGLPPRGRTPAVGRCRQQQGLA